MSTDAITISIAILLTPPLYQVFYYIKERLDGDASAKQMEFIVTQWRAEQHKAFEDISAGNRKLYQDVRSTIAQTLRAPLDAIPDLSKDKGPLN